jgi:hypothetical protein
MNDLVTFLIIEILGSYVCNKTAGFKAVHCGWFSGQVIRREVHLQSI